MGWNARGRGSRYVDAVRRQLLRGRQELSFAGLQALRDP